jgi:hypothetical protein
MALSLSLSLSLSHTHKYMHMHACLVEMYVCAFVDVMHEDMHFVFLISLHLIVNFSRSILFCPFPFFFLSSSEKWLCSCSLDIRANPDAALC